MDLATSKRKLEGTDIHKEYTYILYVNFGNESVFGKTQTRKVLENTVDTAVFFLLFGARAVWEGTDACREQCAYTRVQKHHFGPAVICTY